MDSRSCLLYTSIINKAKQAADEYENAQREEQELLGQIENGLMW